MNKSRFLVVTLAIVVAAMCRVVPHPPNFAPLTALALFAGAALSNRWFALAIPLTTIVLSDFVISLHSGHQFLYGGIAMVYLAHALTVAVGMGIQSNRSVVRVGCGILSATAVFFVVSNLGAWWTYFEHTGAGLARCYVLAIPFLGNAAAANLLFGGVLFGGFALLESRYPHVLREFSPKSNAATPAIDTVHEQV